jgi:hypothetical protein
MAVEDNPRYPEWKAALDNWIDAKAAQARGEASKTDVSLAEIEYNRVCDEIGHA